MEDFASLEKIVMETFRNLLDNKDFDLFSFIQNMETQFKILGFRDPPKGGDSVNSILLIRWDNVGDFILTTPAIREIRMNYPHAFITLVVRQKAYKVAELCPYVNEVLVFDGVNNPDDWLQDIYFGTVFSKQYLWRRRYDLAFSFRLWEDCGWSILALWLMYMSGARERVAYRHDAFHIYNQELLPPNKNISCALLTRPVLFPKEIVHEVSRCLYLVQSYGLRLSQIDLEIWYNKTDLYEAKKLLGNFGEERVKVFVAIGAQNPARVYPVEKYLIAFKEIISKGASIVLLGGPSEFAAAKFLEEKLPKEFVKNLVPIKTGWRIDAAITSLCDMYIGNDTGALHVAVALKKPVIEISRVARDRKKVFPDVPTELDTYQPYQTDAIILQPEHQLDECKTKSGFGGCSSKNSHCIAQIEPSEIVAAYDKLISFMRDVKKVSCPVLVKGIDQVEPLKLRD